MFMRKYIHLAKSLKPQLTKEAADLISEEYTKLRNQDNLETDHLARVIDLKALIWVQSKHKKTKNLFIFWLLIQDPTSNSPFT
jgi:DNA replicative helicase MCM subunit Mcm2 (Cdc46/Mcm family)